MAIVGTVHLLVFGFESRESMPAAVVDHLRSFRGHGIVRLLDVIVATRDKRGVFHLDRDGTKDVTASMSSADDSESALWSLLDSGVLESGRSVPLELHSAREIGFDLEAVEGLAYRIATDSSVLMLLVETTWATGLVDHVVRAGGYAVGCGCLEPETMLIMGPRLAAAAEARGHQDAVVAAHALRTLDLLTARHSSTVAVDVIRTLLNAGTVDPADVDAAVSALAAAHLISLKSTRSAAAVDKSANDIGDSG
jgi:hypothetical protein